MNALYDRPRLLMALVSLFWAINFVIGRAVAGVIPPISLAALRWCLAFLIFLPFAWPYLKEDAGRLRRAWLLLAFLSIIGPGCFNTLTYMGLQFTEAMNGLVLNSAMPMFIAIAAWAIFGDAVSFRQMAGMIAAFLGVLIILVKGHLGAMMGIAFNWGDLLLVTAIIAWSIYTAYLRKRPLIHWQSFAAVTYGVAGLVNLPAAFIEHARGSAIAWTPAAIAIILYVATFPSLIAYIFYNRGVELLGPARAGIYLFLVPVFGAILAATTLGEELHPFHGIGFALILSGIVVGSRITPATRPLPRSSEVAAPLLTRPAEPSPK